MEIWWKGVGDERRELEMGAGMGARHRKAGKQNDVED